MCHRFFIGVVGLHSSALAFSENFLSLRWFWFDETSKLFHGCRFPGFRNIGFLWRMASWFWLLQERMESGLVPVGVAGFHLACRE